MNEYKDIPQNINDWLKMEDIAVCSTIIEIDYHKFPFNFFDSHQASYRLILVD